jgi:hypothetical protein
MAATGSVDLLARTLAQTEAIVARVRPEQATLPTPCASWDVRALVNHVVHDVQQFTVTVHGGEFPATWRVGQQIADLAVHGWDIAKATGQPTDLDPEVGQLALDWGRENLKPQFRGDEASGRAFGPEVAVAADAPLYDRLAGASSRTWTSGRSRCSWSRLARVSTAPV